MDRFIAERFDNMVVFNQSLKSNMDRFIVYTTPLYNYNIVCLKSNMDRFIALGFELK